MLLAPGDAPHYMHSTATSRLYHQKEDPTTPLKSKAARRDADGRVLIGPADFVERILISMKKLVTGEEGEGGVKGPSQHGSGGGQQRRKTMANAIQKVLQISMPLASSGDDGDRMMNPSRGPALLHSLVEASLQDSLTARCVAAGVERQLGDAMIRHDILEAFHQEAAGCHDGLSCHRDGLSGVLERLLEATRHGTAPTASMLEEAAVALVKGEIHRASEVARQEREARAEGSNRAVGGVGAVGRGHVRPHNIATAFGGACPHDGEPQLIVYADGRQADSLLSGHSPIKVPVQQQQQLLQVHPPMSPVRPTPKDHHAGRPTAADLSAAAVEGLSILFADLDRPGSGRIQIRILSKHLSLMARQAKRRGIPAIEELIVRYKGISEIDFRGFRELMVAALELGFRILDVDGSGALDSEERNELLHAFEFISKFNEPPTPQLQLEQLEQRQLDSSLDPPSLLVEGLLIHAGGAGYKAKDRWSRFQFGLLRVLAMGLPRGSPPLRSSAHEPDDDPGIETRRLQFGFQSWKAALLTKKRPPSLSTGSRVSSPPQQNRAQQGYSPPRSSPHSYHSYGGVSKAASNSIKSIFKLLDNDNSGRVSRAEFKKHGWLLSKFPGGPALLGGVAGGGNGYTGAMNLEEFGDFLLNAVEMTFEGLDADHSGDIDHIEQGMVREAFGLSLDQARDSGATCSLRRRDFTEWLLGLVGNLDRPSFTKGLMRLFALGGRHREANRLAGGGGGSGLHGGVLLARAFRAWGNDVVGSPIHRTRLQREGSKALLSKPALMALKALFSHMDADRSGYIDAREFQKHGWILARFPGENGSLVRGWATSGWSSRISCSEFESFVVSTLERVFDQLDVDHSGDLDEEEQNAILEAWDIPPPPPPPKAAAGPSKGVRRLSRRGFVEWVLARIETIPKARFLAGLLRLLALASRHKHTQRHQYENSEFERKAKTRHGQVFQEWAIWARKGDAEWIVPQGAFARRRDRREKLRPSKDGYGQTCLPESYLASPRKRPEHAEGEEREGGGHRGFRVRPSADEDDYYYGWGYGSTSLASLAGSPGGGDGEASVSDGFGFEEKDTAGRGRRVRSEEESGDGGGDDPFGFDQTRSSRDLPGKGGREPKGFTPGARVTYRPTGESVVILRVHAEDFEPYYTVQMGDKGKATGGGGREKQTTRDKLKLLHDEDGDNDGRGAAGRGVDDSFDFEDKKKSKTKKSSPNSRRKEGLSDDDTFAFENDSPIKTIKEGRSRRSNLFEDSEGAGRTGGGPRFISRRADKATERVFKSLKSYKNGTASWREVERHGWLLSRYPRGVGKLLKDAEAGSWRSTVDMESFGAFLLESLRLTFLELDVDRSTKLEPREQLAVAEAFDIMDGSPAVTVSEKWLTLHQYVEWILEAPHKLPKDAFLEGLLRLFAYGARHRTVKRRAIPSTVLARSMRRMFRSWAHEHPGALLRPIQQVKKAALDAADNASQAVAAVAGVKRELQQSMNKIAKGGGGGGCGGLGQADQPSTRRAEDYAWYDPLYRESSTAGQRLIREHYDSMIKGGEMDRRLDSGEDRWDQEQLVLEQEVLAEVDQMEANIFSSYGGGILSGHLGVAGGEDDLGMEDFADFSEVLQFGVNMGPEDVTNQDLDAFRIFRNQYIGSEAPAAPPNAGSPTGGGGR